MKCSVFEYFFILMTSWAVVCDITYLPSMQRKPEESSVAFANRVKSKIAEAGCLENLVWDSHLKRMKHKDEWKKNHQATFAASLKI